MQKVVELYICRWIYSQPICQVLWNLNTYPDNTKYLHSYKFCRCNIYEFIKHNLISKSGISFLHKIKKEVLGRIYSMHGLFEKF